jgi:tripartite-type tricarboxylate transporter receptor subunit TctC
LDDHTGYPAIDNGVETDKPLQTFGEGTMTKFITRPAPSRRGIIKAAGVVAAAIAAPALLRVGPAYADFPDRPVKFVVANTPGGPSDIVARIVTAALEQSTGKTFIVENRGGAGGNIGMEYAAHSDPDGYTILLATNAYSVNYGLYNHLPYDPYKDFVGVSELASSPNTFVVRSEQPVKTIKDFVALARANPEKYNCATPPIGTTPQIQLEVLKIRDKLPKLEDVVFKGGGDAIAALLSGTVQLSSGSLPPAAPHIKAGTCRCLAVTGDARWPDLPDVPTMEEAGYKDFVFATDTVLLAPAKTPPEAVKWLEVATLKVLATPDMKEKLYKAGFLVRPKGADAAWARVTKEIDMFKRIIDQAGIQKL